MRFYDPDGYFCYENVFKNYNGSYKQLHVGRNTLNTMVKTNVHIEVN